MPKLALRCTLWLVCLSLTAWCQQPLDPPLTNWPVAQYWSPTPAAPSADTKTASERAAGVEPKPAAVSGPLVFIAVTPCRIADTRPEQGKPAGFGPPALAPYVMRDFNIPASTCGIPATALAYSLNFTAIPNGPLSFLSAWQAGQPYPQVSTLNSPQGAVIANAAIVPAGTGGAISVIAGESTHLVIDINGYFSPLSSVSLTGTAAAPAITFGSANTGLFSSTANTLGFSTGGVTRVNIRADGDLDLFGNIRRSGSKFLHVPVDTSNLGVGLLTLNAITAGQFNTAVGGTTLSGLVNGSSNTAVGYAALSFLQNGCCNTAMGDFALRQNTSHDNTAVGYAALQDNTTGFSNIALGTFAGGSSTGGSENIYLGHAGVGVESNTVRFGTTGVHNRFFAAGIRGITTGTANAIAVVIDANGQLGTVSSSRRTKTGIQAMPDTTETIMRLKPVQFRYKLHPANTPLQYGLIAEDVAAVAPDLVVTDAEGRPETVFYDKVNAMLLNEVQTLHRKSAAQDQVIREMERRLADMEAARSTQSTTTN